MGNGSKALESVGTVAMGILITTDRTRSIADSGRNGVIALRTRGHKEDIAAQGFEPRHDGSKPSVLPLDDAALGTMDSKGVEPLTSGCRPDVFPLELTAQFTYYKTSHQGIEPCVSCFGDRRFTIEPYDSKWYSVVPSHILCHVEAPYYLHTRIP